MNPSDSETVMAALDLLCASEHDTRCCAAVALAMSMMADSGANLVGSELEINGRKYVFVCGAGHVGEMLADCRDSIGAVHSDMEGFKSVRIVKGGGE